MDADLELPSNSNSKNLHQICIVSRRRVDPEGRLSHMIQSATFSRLTTVSTCTDTGTTDFKFKLRLAIYTSFMSSLEFGRWNQVLLRILVSNLYSDHPHARNKIQSDERKRCARFVMAMEAFGSFARCHGSLLPTLAGNTRILLIAPFMPRCSEVEGKRNSPRPRKHS